MLIKFQKNDSIQKKITIISLWLISLIFIGEILINAYSIYINKININLKSIIIACSILLLFSSLLLRSYIARIIILIISFIMVFSVVYVTLSLLNIGIMTMSDFYGFIYKLMPNLAIIYLLTNKESLVLFKVKSIKKELLIILPLSISLLLGYIWFIQ